MYQFFLTGIVTLNQLLTAGIAITAFALLLYAMTFNLRDRVARYFALVLMCVVIVYVSGAIGSAVDQPLQLEFWLRFRWVGLIFMPVAYLHFSDALLATTGKPSRGRRRLLIRLSYLISLAFLLLLPFSILVGPLAANMTPAPHLKSTWMTWVFTLYYVLCMAISFVGFFRASQRTVTGASQRRMRYLLVGGIAPAVGSFPFLVFGSTVASAHPLIFWLAATISNLLVSVLLVLAAYAVAFFGVPWPDRVVKRRLFKWLMRGPVTASTVLAITTIVRRLGERFGQPYSGAVPIAMVGSLLLLQFMITLAAPVWERWLFHGGDREKIALLQALEERLLTSSDLRQFLESILAAVCDRMQVTEAFIAVLNQGEMEMVVPVGNVSVFQENAPDELQQLALQNGNGKGSFSWGSYRILPLYGTDTEDAQLLGILGFLKTEGQEFEREQQDALELLSRRASIALEDRARQQQVFVSLEALNPQMEMIQRLRAAARYNDTGILTAPDEPLERDDLVKWVKEALTHYWGGPKLTTSPLMHLRVVQDLLVENDDNPANALRAILRQGIDQVRPTGERRFTGEWILYNILEMKFMEGRKVREIAMRLALSEADLYRKQRVAIEYVANAISDMEQKARKEENLAD
jgi:GAF domain-containing protein